MFDKVQSQFKHLSDLLNGFDHNKHLAGSEKFSDMVDALSQTYILLNQGFCENVEVCEKCVDNRDRLREVIEMVDRCEPNKKLDESTHIALSDFALNIPNMLSKMESVYLSSIKD